MNTTAKKIIYKTTHTLLKYNTAMLPKSPQLIPFSKASGQDTRQEGCEFPPISTSKAKPGFLQESGLPTNWKSLQEYCAVCSDQAQSKIIPNGTTSVQQQAHTR